MAANQVIAEPDTINTGEGISDGQSLSCLNELLLPENDRLTTKQKDLIQQLVDRHDLTSTEDDVAPFDMSAYKGGRTNSDVFSTQPHLEINWCDMIFTAFIIAISSFVFGYVTVEASLIIDVTKPISHGAFNKDFPDLPHFIKDSLIPSCPLIGACIGSISLFVFNCIFQKYPRKKVLLATNIPIMVGCVLSFLCVFTISPYMLLLGLILKGIGIGMSSVIVPVILAEIAPSPVRHVITMFHQLFVTFGILISSSVTLPLIQIENGWRYITGFVFVPCALQLLLQKYIPFTPRWLIANAKFEEAKAIFTRIYGSETYDEVSEEVDHIHKHIMIDENMANHWRKPLFIGITMNVFQQWTGINVVIYGAQRALKEQQIDEDNIFVAIMILYFINFVSTALCCVAMKMRWFKKKTLYYIGTSLMCLMLTFLGLINIEYHTDTFIMSQLSISQIPLYVVGFAISLGTFNWELVTEAFPFENRVRFASICIFVQWFCNGALSMSVDSISDTYLDGKSGPLYFIFCGMIIFCIMFIKRYIPKTTGKSLETAVNMYMK